MTAVAHRSAVKEAAAIVEACREIRDGKPHDQFVVDVIQGRAGTSANMNAGEVIANRALELLGHARGEFSAYAGAGNEALATGRGVAELVRAKGLLPAGTLAQLLRPEADTGPGQALV